MNKMSKSLGNAIGIHEPPLEMYGKIMSVSDEMMWRYYELLTDVLVFGNREDEAGCGVGRGAPHGAEDKIWRARLRADFTVHWRRRTTGRSGLGKAISKA